MRQEKRPQVVPASSLGADDPQLQATLINNARNQKDNLNLALPEELQNGVVVKHNIVTGANEIRHSLNRYPIGFVCLSGNSVTLSINSKTQTSITLQSSGFLSGAYIWIF
jgi:hypothetical protein